MKQVKSKKNSVVPKALRQWLVQLFHVEKYRFPEPVFFLVAIVLIVFGFIILTSASSVVALRQYDDSYYFLKQQLFQGFLLGLLAAVVMYHVSLEWLKKWSQHIFVASLVLLILVLIPQFGDARLGASRWLALGPFSFQPSEVAKFAFILYLAAWLTKQSEYIKSFKKTFVPFLAVLSFVGALLIFQPDMGTMGIFALIALTMFFVAGGNFLHLTLLGGVGIGLVAWLIRIAPYRAARLTTFLNPELDPQGLGYHINQALLAIGSGGIFGKGLGHSRQKFQYLPEVYGDSIFAVMAEELGFILTVLVIVFCLYFIIRGLHIAHKVPDRYASLVVTGIMAWWGFQTIINIAAMVGLMPLTGLPWPFVSYGSTAYAINMTALGLVLNISRTMRQK